MPLHIAHDFGRFARKIEEQERSMQKRMERVGRAIAERGLALYSQTITGWSWRPHFQSVVRMLGYVLSVNIGTDDWKYRMIDETGSRRHPITPRGPWPLRFRWGGPGSYVAKTTPGVIGTNMAGGRSRGPEIRVRSVMHPGFKPRRFTQVIRKELEGTFVEEMDKDFSLWATQWG